MATWSEWQSSVGQFHKVCKKRMITYTLQSESGASLRGAGWKVLGEVKPQSWDRKGRQREWQPIYGQLKFRWGVET